ncbi:hypothetical protein F4819DRAFT_508163 [Hypoxylon fuscum]|nr:hypothetical protein F4819DRAFT_508163 [Hypoxylon fuscum]
MGLMGTFFDNFGPGMAAYVVCKVLQFILPHAWAWAVGDLELMRYLHASNGKPAWAFVACAIDPIGQAMCFELAARGFNLVMYGHDRQQLGATKAKLEKDYPWNKYRIVLSDTYAESGSAEELAIRIAHSLEHENLTVLVNNFTATGQTHENSATLDRDAKKTFPMQLTTALISLLRRNAPSLVLNIVSMVANRDDVEPLLCSSCGTFRSCEKNNIDMMSYRLGESAAGDEQPSYLKPDPKALASAILRHAGAGLGRPSTAVIPYWPHAMQHMARTMRWAVNAYCAVEFDGGKGFRAYLKGGLKM